MSVVTPKDQHDADFSLRFERTHDPAAARKITPTYLLQRAKKRSHMGIYRFHATLDRPLSPRDLNEFLATELAGTHLTGLVLTVTREAKSLNAAITQLIRDVDRFGCAVIRVEHDEIG